jgi:hypothetical protein
MSIFAFLTKLIRIADSAFEAEVEGPPYTHHDCWMLAPCERIPPDATEAECNDALIDSGVMAIMEMNYPTTIAQCN